MEYENIHNALIACKRESKNDKTFEVIDTEKGFIVQESKEFVDWNNEIILIYKNGKRIFDGR